MKNRTKEKNQENRAAVIPVCGGPAADRVGGGGVRRRRRRAVAARARPERRLWWPAARAEWTGRGGVERRTRWRWWRRPSTLVERGARWRISPAAARREEREGSGLFMDEDGLGRCGGGARRGGARSPRRGRRPWRRGGVREAESRPGGRGRAGVGLGRGLAGCWAGPVRRRGFFLNRERNNKNKRK